MSLRSPHHEKCPMRMGGDWCNCFALRGHDADLDRMKLDQIKYDAIRKDAARRCIEIVDKIEPGTPFTLDTIILRIRNEFGLTADSTVSEHSAIRRESK